MAFEFDAMARFMVKRGMSWAGRYADSVSLEQYIAVIFRKRKVVPPSTVSEWNEFFKNSGLLTKMKAILHKGVVYIQFFGDKQPLKMSELNLCWVTAKTNRMPDSGIKKSEPLVFDELPA
ncbi:MAG: hypothetical protein R3B38_02450 [Patescibacteria group bacterium]